MMEPELRNNGSSQSEEQPASGQKSVKCSVRKKKSLRARYAYGVIFLLTNIIAWLFRDYGERILPVLPYSRACGAEERECYHTMGVLRIFFFLMFVTTCNTRKLDEKRNAWHSGWWALKFVLLLISFVIPFFIPTDYIQLYGELARVGAAVMYVLYASKTSCSLNIFFISWTGVLLIVMMVISLHSRVNRGLLSSGIMASYIVFLCWTAIRSEPGSEKCSPQKQESGHGGWSTIVGFVIALCAIVIATFSTGIDSQTFQVGLAYNNESNILNVFISVKTEPSCSRMMFHIVMDSSTFLGGHVLCNAIHQLELRQPDKKVEHRRRLG
ncbi:UNVERIFIED_CONTAM: hypothetical protein Sangu_1136200 [Sesamum angustifolium]|uniref:Serine incorporator 3 n=1 Tax=Sesamum angustifolium TaxID=2727405 RepID=A0AAW2NZB4_9LAMI